jgi:hypothetical protein
MEKNLNKKIEVYDDIVPKSLQDFFEMSILGTHDNTQVITPIVGFKCKYEASAPKEEGQQLSFVHVLNSPSYKSEFLPQFSLIAAFLTSRIGVVMADIPMARIYIQPPSIHSTKHYEPHVDSDIPHIVVLYYVNDADGDTYFFDDDGNTIKTVSPKKGRVAVFDGSIMHGGGVPKKGKRSVVNLNVVIR